MSLSIRWKVTLCTLLAVALGLGVAGWLAVRSLERVELARIEDALSTRAGLASFALQPILLEPATSSRLQAMAKELGRQAQARVTVIAADGAVLADSAVSDAAVAALDNHRTRPEIEQASSIGRGTHIRKSETTGLQTFYLALPVAGQHHLLGFVRLGLPLTDVEARVGYLKQALGIAFGIAFIVSLAASIFLARRLTGALSEMAAVARQVAGGAFTQRLAVTSNDEVGVLAATLNRMADQLDHDITALHRLERVRKDFVANVSHELRTPLTSIKGYVEALLDGAKDDPDTAVKFLDIILKQSDRLNLILDDLLQLSQIESGQVLFKHEPVQLSALIDRTLAILQPLAEKKGHRITVTLEPNLPLVMGDEDRLGQVFSNLLDNAVKYTPDQGTVTIEAHTLVAPAAGTGARRVVDLVVADSGIGIPEADRPRVFERFYRVDKARSRELGGTGLGLSIVKHIVEGHGGEVWVEGNEPHGSRFVVRLPAGRPAITTALP